MKRFLLCLERQSGRPTRTPRQENRGNVKIAEVDTTRPLDRSVIMDMLHEALANPQTTTIIVQANAKMGKTFKRVGILAELLTAPNVLFLRSGPRVDLDSDAWSTIPLKRMVGGLAPDEIELVVRRIWMGDDPATGQPLEP